MRCKHGQPGLKIGALNMGRRTVALHHPHDVRELLHVPVLVVQDARQGAGHAPFRYRAFVEAPLRFGHQVPQICILLG